MLGLCPGLLRGVGVLGPQRPAPGALLPAHLLQGEVAPAQAEHLGTTLSHQADTNSISGGNRGGLRYRNILQDPEDSVEPV